MAKQRSDEESTIILLQDGWSNIKNDPIIAASIHTGKKTFLYKAMDCEANKKNC